MLKYEYKDFTIKFSDEIGNERWICNIDENTKIEAEHINDVKKKIDNFINKSSNYENLDAFCLEFNSTISKVKVRGCIENESSERFFWVEDETGLRSKTDKVFAYSKNNIERIELIDRLRNNIQDSQKKIAELLSEMDIL